MAGTDRFLIRPDRSCMGEVSPRAKFAMLSRTPMTTISVLAAALLGACAHELALQRMDEARAGRSHVVVVDRARVVAFVPDLLEAQAEIEPGLQSALEHFGYAIAATDKCLRPHGIPVDAVYANEIVFEDGGRRFVVDLGGSTNESMGCAFVAPGRAPTIVRATAGPSSLVSLCPATAASYFSIPACCPEGWQCCSDGTVVDVDLPCPPIQ